MIHLGDASIVRSMYDDESKCNTIPQPKWHQIKAGFGKSSPPCGEVLCSFALVDPNYKWKQNFSKIEDIDMSGMVHTKNYNIDINVLGLRDLESFGILPIKKPFISFNIRSLQPEEKSEAV